MSSQGSQIFAGYRALGFYCNHVPLALRYHKKHRDHYVVTAVGKAFHTYNCSKLGIVSVSNSHPDEILCLAVDAFLVYTGCQNVIRAFANGRQMIHVYEGHGSDVQLLLPFGEHLVSVDEDSKLKIWDIKSTEIYLDLEFDPVSFRITALMHPTTYMNKILLGSRQGSMQLWNIKTNKLIYTFDGWGAPITVIEQAPAVDVVAVGLADGRIIVHNLKYDETLVTFTQEWGPVTAIAFRTDGQPIMATASNIGHIALWNLEEKRLQAQMRNAHQEGVAGMAFLQSEPVMITNSSDNHIKMWLLDQADGSGRELRARMGHSLPATKIRFHGQKGQNILSAGQDSSLKSFSTIHENRNKNLGQAYLNKVLGKKKRPKLEHLKMSPITRFTSETSRESDWDGIAACHQQFPLVTTWNYQRSTMGKHKLTHDRFKGQDGVMATAIDITSCGNFVVIGWSTGHVDTFNLQSGLHRGSFGPQHKAHKGSVRGMAVDALNQILLTGSSDGTLKFWKYKTKQLLHTLDLSNPINNIVLHRESSMLAVNTDDFTIHIVDVELRRVVRRFSGHHNGITDMDFSQDARWLVSASMDCTIRTWDMPTGRLIDCFLMDAAPTSIALSPTGDFLASTHVDDLGIYLWSNKTLYSHVSLRPLPDDFVPTVVALPGTSYQVKQDIESGEDSGIEDLLEPEQFESPEQISEDLVTLSTLPNSRWQSLVHLDIIKMRNKPKEPPKAPKAAPFFLPTVAGLTPTFVAPDEDKDKESSKIVKFSPSGGLQSDLCKTLEQVATTEQYDPVMEYMKSLTPSAIDAELRSLSPIGGGSTEAMSHFIAFLKHSLASNHNFELAQAYLGLFIKIHGNDLTKDLTLITMVTELADEQSSSWLRVQKEFNQSLCLINYLRNAAL